MRLAHFSDLHLLSHGGAGWLKLCNKRWIGAANLLSNRSRHYHVAAFDQMVDDLNAQAVDHVICTGDVTNLALEQEFAFARAKFDRLAAGPHHVTVIPGNHDAYVAEGIGFFAKIFDPYHRGDPGFAPLSDAGSAGTARRQLSSGEGPEINSESSTALQVRDASAPDGDLRWPFVRIRGDIALIGVTTSRATPWFTAYGRVGEPQLARLRQFLVDDRVRNKVRIVAIHHPPAGKAAHNRIRGLRDHEAFARVIHEVGCDLILHGHEHRDMAEVLPGPHGPVPVRGIASGTYEHDKPHRTARYRIFNIENGRITAEQLRIWRRDPGHFEAETGA